MAGKNSSVGKVQGRPALADPFNVIPLRFGDDPYVWACWLYYEDGLTQGEIADIMGISRATVNSYLADARERKIVNIALDPSHLRALSTAQEAPRQAQALGMLERFRGAFGGRRGLERLRLSRLSDALQMGGMSGTDAEGYGGLNDKVDRHYLRTF